MPARIPLDTAKVLKMRAAGESFAQIAEHFGVHHMTIRRIVTPGYGPKSPKPPKPRKPAETTVFQTRITDYPDSLTAAIFGDPTPQRRALLDGVVNSVIPSGDHPPTRTAENG